MRERQKLWKKLIKKWEKCAKSDLKKNKNKNKSVKRQIKMKKNWENIKEEKKGKYPIWQKITKNEWKSTKNVIKINKKTDNIEMKKKKSIMTFIKGPNTITKVSCGQQKFSCGLDLAPGPWVWHVWSTRSCSNNQGRSQSCTNHVLWGLKLYH